MKSLTQVIQGIDYDSDAGEGESMPMSKHAKGKSAAQQRNVSKPHRKQDIHIESPPVQQQQQQMQLQAPPDLGMPSASALQEGIQKVLEIGSKPWRRSKIMLVGEGRAGKTALANSILGKDFAETASTVGINQLTCDIKYASVGDNASTSTEGPGGGGSGHWNACEAPKNLLETSVAQMLAGPQPSRSEAGRKEAVEQEDSESAEVGYLDEDEFPLADPVLSIINPNNITGSPSPPAKPSSIDNELVMQRLSSEIKSNSKYIVSLFDFGGQSVFNVIHPFFLTQHGVYVVVFNMEWLLSPEKIDYQHCLDYLSFWVNSIIIHTQTSSRTRISGDQDESEVRIAPWVLVGTR